MTSLIAVYTLCLVIRPSIIPKTIFEWIEEVLNKNEYSSNAYDDLKTTKKVEKDAMNDLTNGYVEVLNVLDVV